MIWALGICGASTAASTAHAATALVRWLPSAASSGYRVYIRNSGGGYLNTPQWSGSAAAETDGSLSTLVTYTPASWGTNYFAVTAVGSGTESAISDELPIGAPNPCAVDSCSTKTSCEFSASPDGTLCDDDSYCGGTKVCRSGACVCGDLDPCLASGAGNDIDVDRIRFREGRSSIKLVAKGRFPANVPFDPTVTGAVFELLDPEGAPLYAAAIAPDAFVALASDTHYRFVSRRADADPAWKGLIKLDFHAKHGVWIVTAKADSPDLMQAYVEPTLTWAIRFGAACVRQADLSCEQQSKVTVCR